MRAVSALSAVRDRDAGGVLSAHYGHDSLRRCAPGDLPRGHRGQRHSAAGAARLADPQAAFNFHVYFYCSATQDNTTEVPVGSPSSAAQTCAPVEQTQLNRFTNFANRLGVPGFLSEFSCDDVNPDNTQIVDLMAHTFTSWTAWAYYNGAADPADCSTQGPLINDQLAGSEANARQDKLDALAVPYARRSRAFRSARALTGPGARTGCRTGVGPFPARVSGQQRRRWSSSPRGCISVATWSSLGARVSVRFRMRAGCDSPPCRTPASL